MRSTSCLLAALGLVAILTSGCSGLLVLHGNYCGPKHPGDSQLPGVDELRAWIDDYDEVGVEYLRCTTATGAESCAQTAAAAIDGLARNSASVRPTGEDLFPDWWGSLDEATYAYTSCVGREGAQSPRCPTSIIQHLETMGPPQDRNFAAPPIDDLDQACRSHDLCWARQSYRGANEDFPECNRNLVEVAELLQPASERCEILAEDVATYFGEAHPERTVSGRRYGRLIKVPGNIRVGMLVGTLVLNPKVLYTKTSDRCCDLKAEARERRSIDDPCYAETFSDVRRRSWTPSQISEAISESLAKHRSSLEREYLVHQPDDVGQGLDEGVRARFELGAKELVLLVLQKPKWWEASRRPRTNQKEERVGSADTFRGWVITTEFVHTTRRKKTFEPFPLADLPRLKIRGNTSGTGLDLGDGVDRRRYSRDDAQELLEFFRTLASQLAQMGEAVRGSTESAGS